MLMVYMHVACMQFKLNWEFYYNREVAIVVNNYAVIPTLKLCTKYYGHTFENNRTSMLMTHTHPLK